MTLYKELSYDGEECVAHIKGIQFSIMGPEEIRKRSVAEITKTDTYAINEPVMNGLFDPRMGVVDNNKICKTCEQRNTFCPGHFGHIELARPLFYVQFFGIIQKLLRCVCFRCSKLLIDVDDPAVVAILAKKIPRMKRWERMHKLCSNVKRCGKETLDGCGARQPDRITKSDAMKILMEWKDLADAAAVADSASTSSNIRRQVLGADDVLRILRRITDADADALGFCPKYNRPEWMICTILPVPPPCVRPSVRNDTGVRKEDDLTHKLGDIIKYNNLIKSKIEKGASYELVEGHLAALQQHVATLIDNSGAWVSKDRTGRLFRTICDRLNRKEGRIRGNLMGKRVDFSARTVITPDPNISIDELGVPLRIAMNLTFPEVVNEFNVESMYRLVRNGPDVYPGAKHIRKGSRTIRLKGNDREAITLDMGDIVERHLMNGDYVLFNRQPSLHKMSMMAHRVRVMPHNTFRLNVCVCASYNADFDGDEMNMHVPQSLQSHEEIMQLAAVPLHIISPRHSKPIISIVQDVALGVFRITQGHVTVSEKQLFNLTCSNPIFMGSIPRPISEGDDARWSGRQLLSTIIPPTIMLNMYPDKKPDEPGFDAADHHIYIRCGELTSGILTTKTFNDPARGLIRSIFNEGGPNMVATFLNNTQKLICDWLVLSGFSVGISDLLAPAYKRERIKQQIEEMHAGVAAKIAALHAGEMKNISTLNNRQFFEGQIESVTRTCIGSVEKVALGDIDVRTNRMLNMIKSGSKGQPINFMQMLACLGQQSIDGQRIPDGFDNRTLPHFTRYDDGPQSRGFVEHSFIEGLTPQEFFFHSMAGRVGLIDTAVRSVTWETPIIIIEDGKSKYVRIGEWIDAHMSSEDSKEKIKVYPEDRNLEMMELPKRVYIPTLDGDGHVTWGRMTSVTRHDPGERLYKVVTKGGREVTVAESKSLLVFNEVTGKFEEKDSREVKVGDAVPVLATLPEPPVIVHEFDVSEYMSKTEYIHGTDFNRAVKMMKEVQGDNYFIPRGWWEANNGISFTLPYPNKARLQRAALSGRSKTDNILDGYIYLYGASRQAGLMPEKFKLDRDNGIFIGIYLADGHCHVTSGVVGITKNDNGVQDFVMSWFKRYNIKHRLQDNSVYDENHPTKICGTSITLHGYSTLMAKFLDKFVGHGSKDKHVPDVAFTAPQEFIVGLLGGYFSGDGTFTKGIGACSVSRRLTEGIAMLCNYLGSFSKISATIPPPDYNNNLGTETIAPTHHLAMRAQYGARFKNAVTLVHNKKSENLQQLKFTASHVNYKEHNDVVKDQIITITVLGAEDHPKLYDVTVPSTLNFILANGLGCQDTSESGYLQRKLVTFMQDLKVHADLSVRNSAGQVIQFLYGEDGIDATQVEYQILPYVESTVAAMRDDHLLLSMSEISAYVTDKVAQKPLDTGRMISFFEQLVSDRDFAIEVKRGRMDSTVMHPVNVSIIVMRASEIMAAHGVAGPSDLHPEEVLDVIEDLTRTLTCSLHTDKQAASRYMQMLLRCHLSPKVIITKRRFTRSILDVVTKQIRTRFFESIAHPGEMVGILAAQSIGEPTTQTTLNSVHYDTEFLLRIHGRLMRVTIGSFVDNALANNTCTARLEQHPNDTTLLWLKDGGDEGDVPSGVEVLSCTEDGAVVWDEVTAVTRHPVINEDGSDTLIKVTYRSGRSVTATKGLSFVKRVNNVLSAVKGSDLRVGDRLPVSQILPILPNELSHTMDLSDGIRLELNMELGQEIGTYLATGTCQPGYNLLMEWVCGPAEQRRFPAHFLASPLPFLQGVLYGYILANSSMPSPGIIMTSAVSDKILADLSLMFARFGIRVTMEQQQKTLTIYTECVASDGNDVVPDIVLHNQTLTLSRQEALDLLDRTVHEVDRLVLDTVCKNHDIFFDEIVDIQEVPNTRPPYVYDLTTRKTRCFCTYGNSLLYDTFHLSGLSSASIMTQQGVPRLQELFHVSKNIKTPYMRIFIKEPWSTDMSRCRDVCSAVQTTRFRDVIRESKVYYDPIRDSAAATTNIPEDRGLMEAYAKYSLATQEPATGSPWVLRFEFDRTKMLELQASMLDLEIVLQDFYDDTISCLFSDDNAVTLIARIRLVGKDVDANDMLTELRALEENILNTVVIKGIKNIEKAVPLKPSEELIYDAMTGTFVKLAEWAVETSGSNLIEVLSMPHVDPVRTYTNDINEVYQVLGIEAARQALYNELQAVMWQKDTNSVNYRHMALLVDAMTSRGFLTSVNRHGINKGDIGPLAKCSFEQTTDMLINAGVFAEVDRINGVAANIMLGQVAPCGTGDSEILIDEVALQAQAHSVPLPEKRGAIVDRSAKPAAPDHQPTISMPAYRPNAQLPQAGQHAPPKVIVEDDIEIV